MTETARFRAASKKGRGLGRAPHDREQLTSRGPKHCIDIDLPVLPGTVTPSEVTAAVNLGLKVTKFFPAAQYGGLNTIKALAAPFVGHRFMPTGGVSTANVEEYLSSSAIIACGGTWMVKPALFADGDFSKVEQIAREAMDVVKKVRG